MKVFILHYPKLVERKQRLLKELENHRINDYEFIEHMNKDDIGEMYNSRFENINLASASLILKHIYAYQQIADKYERALIFEDDVILDDNFNAYFNLFMEELPSNFDMLFIGNGGNFHVPASIMKPNKYVYLTSEFPDGKAVTKCTDSYVVSKKAAQKLVNYFKTYKQKINLPIDHLLNDVDKSLNLNIYWAEPTIVQQGSETGLFKSTAR